MKQRKETEIREAERQAILYALKQTEKSWKQVLKSAEKSKSKIAITRIKGMFDGWMTIKRILRNRKVICNNQQNLKEEWDYWDEQK